MRPPAILAEERAWGDRFEKILGGSTRAEPAPAPSARPAPAEPDEEDEEFSFNMENFVQRFGRQVLQPDLQSALDDPTPRLLTAAEWTRAVPPLPLTRDQLLREKATVLAGLNGMDRTGQEFLKWQLLRKKVERGIEDPAHRNAFLDSNNLLGRPLTTEDDYNELAGRIDTESHAARMAMSECHEAMGKCLPFLDQPQNNPERARVGVLLGELEAIDRDLSRAPRDAAGVSRKCQKLLELQGKLFGWIDRRTRENLPPAAESVALADLVQKAHLDLIKEIAAQPGEPDAAGVKHGGWPLPIADAHTLSVDEAAEVQQIWADLRDGTGNIQFPVAVADEWESAIGSVRRVGVGSDGSPPVGRAAPAPAPAPAGAAAPAPAAGAAPEPAPEPGPAAPSVEEQFRLEMLANFARMLGTPAGRSQIRQLNKGPHKIEFQIGKTAKCGPKAKDGSASDGRGASAIVYMPPGAKDSDNFLSTGDGNVLFNPQMSVMGHELLHALHITRGEYLVNNLDVTDPLWNNREEFLTIHDGDISENDLRSQYGLSQERFGHIQSYPRKAIATAFKTALVVLEAMPDARRDEIDQLVRDKNFDPASLCDKLKLKLSLDADVRGPLPAGWDANVLTLVQIKDIIRLNLPFILDRLGWKPFGLLVPKGEGDTIEGITRTERHHPRSPLGMNYRNLGGDTALAQIGHFNRATGNHLGVGRDAIWHSQLEALTAAESFLGGRQFTADDVDPEVKRAAAAKGNLTARLKGVAKAWRGVETRAMERKSERLARSLIGGIKELDRSDPHRDRISTELKRLYSARTFEVLHAAQIAVRALVTEKLNTLQAPANDADRAMRTRCDSIVSKLDGIMGDIAVLNDKITDATRYIRELPAAQLTADLLRPLEAMIASRFVPPPVKTTAEEAIARAIALRPDLAATRSGGDAVGSGRAGGAPAAPRADGAAAAAAGPAPGGAPR